MYDVAKNQLEMIVLRVLSSLFPIEFFNQYIAVWEEKHQMMLYDWEVKTKTPLNPNPNNQTTNRAHLKNNCNQIECQWKQNRHYKTESQLPKQQTANMKRR